MSITVERPFHPARFLQLLLCDVVILEHIQMKELMITLLSEQLTDLAYAFSSSAAQNSSLLALLLQNTRVRTPSCFTVGNRSSTNTSFHSPKHQKLKWNTPATTTASLSLIISLSVRLVLQHNAIDYAVKGICLSVRHHPVFRRPY